MANIKKNSKIDFYKVTSLPKVSTGSKTKEGKRQSELQQAARLNTVALNSLGATLNSLGNSLTEFRAVQFEIYKRVDRQSKQDFTAVFNMPTAPKKKQGSAAKQEKIEPPSWLESVFEVVKLALAGLVGGTLFKFLSNEENRKKTKEALEKLFDVIGVITNFFGTVAYHAIDGLWQLLCNEDASWLDRFGGFMKAFVSIGTAFMAIKWLKNPKSLLKDFRKGFKAFRSGLKAVGKKLGKRMLKIGLAGVAITTLVHLFSGNNDPAHDEMARGGKTKKRARGGGFINGPMSGYPVSLDGGQSTSFIGHGLEYVAQKASGGFVVPINTPATQNNSGLMGSRMVEASRMGYDLGGMTKGFDGGGEYTKEGKGRGRAASRQKREEKRFSKLFMAAGGELGKLGDGTKLVTAPGGMCTTGVLDTAGANNAKIGHPNTATGTDPNNPRGLMAQAVGKFGYASLNVGQPKQINSPYAKVGVKEMNFGQWKKAVKGNKVPSGSLVFSTRHNDWNNSASSSGNDSAIAKEGGRKLWSGHWQRVVDGVGAVYGAGTKKVVALVHPKGHSGGFTGEVGPGGGSSPLALSGKAKQLIGGDTEFLEKVKKLSAKYQINPSDLLGKFASESGMDPKANNGTHVGLIQFSKDSAAAIGTSQAALLRMSRAEQMDYVEKYFDYWKLPKGATAGHLYTISYLPAFAKESADYVLAKRGGFSDKNGNHPSSWYDGNKGLDQNGDGMITIGELGERIQKKKREFGISGGETGPYTGSAANTANDTGSAINGVASAATQLMNPLEAFTQLSSKLLGDKAPANPFAESSSGGSVSADEKATTGASGIGAAAAGMPASGIGDSGHASKSGGQASSATGTSENLQKAAAKSIGSAANLSGGSTASAAPAGATNVGGVSASSGSIMTSQTQSTMQAKRKRKSGNREAIVSALQLAEVQNAEITQVKTAAAEASKQAMAMSQPQQQFVPTGGGETKQSLVAKLNSNNNLLKRFES